MQDELPIPGPLGLGDLLDRAFRLYRARFGTWVLIAVLFLVPFTLLSVLINLAVSARTTVSAEALQDMALSTPELFWQAYARLMTSPEGIFSIAVSLLLSLVTYLGRGVATLALTHESIATLHGQRPSLGESIRAGLGRLLPFVGMNLIQGVITIVVMLPVIIPMVWLFTQMIGFGQSDDLDWLMGQMGLLSLAMCCLFPFSLVIYLFLLTRWIVAAPGIVAQRWGPIEALRGSWALTKAQALRSFGYLALLGILEWVITTVLVTVLVSTFAVLPSQFVELSPWISTALNIVFSVLWLPLYVAALVLLYYDLRVRKEGYDLALRVEQLEAEVGRPDTASLEPGAGGA
jgi:hypothetical protein